jgi:predicted phage terminase large subunit-like protein
MNSLTITTEQIEDIIANPSPLHSLMLSNDLATFIAYAHYALNGSNFQFQDFHFLVIKKLQAIVEQKNTKRNLGICMPVGAGKTLLVQYFIAWSFCRSINNAYVYASHSETNIMKLSREVKDMFGHKFLQGLFKLKLKADEGSKSNWSFQGAINRTGLLATPIGSGITGADSGNPNVKSYSGAAVLDDLIDVSKIRRTLALAEVNTSYDEKIATRRRTPKTPTIAVMQRLIIGDFISWVKENEPEDWDIIEIKALNEDETSFWEDRYPAEQLKKIRNSNPFKFYAQYQQEPIRDDGTCIFNKDSFAWYDELPQMDEITDSWDTAVKVKQVNDYSVCEVWGEKRNPVGIKDHYLIFVWRERVLFPKLKAKFREINRLYNPNRSLIEDKSAGETLIPEMKAEGFSGIVAIQTGTQDKAERAAVPSEVIDQGRVFLPKDAPWLDVFLDEVLTFTGDGKSHDDQVDTMTQYLNWSNKPRRTSMGFSA